MDQPSGPTGTPRNMPVTAPGDPKQWHTEDKTPAQRYATSRKEAAAAYSDALKDCGRMSSKERAQCQKDAKSNYNNDLAAARKEYSGK
jgi:hypothetical protein